MTETAPEETPEPEVPQPYLADAIRGAIERELQARPEVFDDSPLVGDYILIAEVHRDGGTGFHIIQSDMAVWKSHGFLGYALQGLNAEQVVHEFGLVADEDD